MNYMRAQQGFFQSDAEHQFTMQGTGARPAAALLPVFKDFAQVQHPTIEENAENEPWRNYLVQTCELLQCWQTFGIFTGSWIIRKATCPFPESAYLFNTWESPTWPHPQCQSWLYSLALLEARFLPLHSPAEGKVGSCAFLQDSPIC